MPAPGATTASEVRLLDTVWNEVESSAADAAPRWPAFQLVERLLSRREDLDARAILQGLPPGLVLGYPEGLGLASDEEDVRLTVAGVAACPRTEKVVDGFLSTLRLAVAAEGSAAGREDAVVLASQVSRAAGWTFPKTSDLEQRMLRLVGLMLPFEPWVANFVTTGGGDAWTLTVKSSSIRNFRQTATIDEYWDPK